MDIALIKLIKAPCIQEYRWHGDKLFIWVADYDWANFKEILKKLCNFDDGGIPARIQEDCIYIDLGDTEIMDDYFEELKVAFPED
ncbi:hypothetical protein AAC591_03660 [Lactiplantibacillus plantarum]|uniref:hypothetical protein n=1 Tax=Lactiplantibacillus plantarum TaxID=1590 RepID=UPI00311CC9FA